MKDRNWFRKRLSEPSTTVGFVAMICAIGTMLGIGLEKDAVSGAVTALESEHYTAFLSAVAGIVAMVLRDKQHEDGEA